MTVRTEARGGRPDADEPRSANESRATRWMAPGLCIVGAALAVAIVPIMGYGLNASDGAGVTELLVDRAARNQSAAILAVFAAAALTLAAARLGRHLGGAAGLVAMGSGTAVAFLLAAYYASFGAGAIVATQVLDDFGPGLGEATLVVANMVELTRFAPSLVLAVVALVARRSLPKPVAVAAGILLAMMLFPVTTWIAAILAPVWLGVAGAAVPDRS